MTEIWLATPYRLSPAARSPGSSTSKTCTPSTPLSPFPFLSHIHTHTERERDRETETERQRETERETDRQTDRQTDRERESERARERARGRESFSGGNGSFTLSGDRNPIGSSPAHAYPTVRISFRHLDRNTISSISKGSFTGLDALMRLYVSPLPCPVSVAINICLAYRVHHDLTALMHIFLERYLDDNAVASLVSGTFIGLGNLNYLFDHGLFLSLRINRCPRQTSDSSSLCGGRSLNNNRITTLVNSTFGGLGNLDYL
jgi:hypothetical protein